MGYGLRQFGMLHHVAYHQRLDRQKAKTPDEFADLLLDERLASVGYALVDARDDLTLERPLFRAFWGSGKLPLTTANRRLFCPEKPAIADFFSLRAVAEPF